jgi:hypothetical protein
MQQSIGGVAWRAIASSTRRFKIKGKTFFVNMLTVFVKWCHISHPILMAGASMSLQVRLKECKMLYHLA